MTGTVPHLYVLRLCRPYRMKRKILNGRHQAFAETLNAPVKGIATSKEELPVSS